MGCLVDAIGLSIRDRVRFCNSPLPIQNVPPKPVAFRNLWMFKITRLVVAESEAFHQSPGSNVYRSRERNDFCQLEGAEAEGESLSRCTEGQSASPEFAAESPADFGAGHKRRGEARDAQPGEPCEPPIYLDHPLSPASFIDGTLHSLKRGSRFDSCHRARKESHHFWITVHLGERFQIGVSPLAQCELLHIDDLRSFPEWNRKAMSVTREKRLSNYVAARNCRRSNAISWFVEAPRPFKPPKI